MTHICIVGGWTEPRGSRPFFGALLVGITDEQGELRYVGRVASGFTDAQLGLVWKQLHALKTKTPPFAVVPDTNARAHWVKPTLADRPLVMKRFPNGIAGKPFYQHRAPDKVPEGVRIERVTTGTETRPHLVGGSLTTLLYTAQLGSISQDPWFSRVQSPEFIDHVAIDLDPPDGLPYARVLDVARWVRDALATLKATGFAKTSGAGGLHVYVPMPPRTPYASGLLFAQIVATLVAEQHPAQATVERSIKARGRRIYVDYMQNGLGKTLASAYSARASDLAGDSTPITWEEVEEGVSPQDFTVANFDRRLESAGDPWRGLRTAKGPDLGSLKRATEARRRGAKT